MAIAGDDVKLGIEIAGLILAIGTIIYRTSTLAAKLEADGKLRASELEADGKLRASEIAEIKSAIAERLGKVEIHVNQMQTILISEARQHERIKSMDDRI